MLVEAAEDRESEGDSYDEVGDAESGTAGTLAMIGIVCVVAGGPVGAVELGGIERHRRDAYVGAVLGELVVGTLGYVLAREIHDSGGAKLAGVGTGVALGAAGGAVLLARSAEPEAPGVFRYEEGRWSVSIPDVRVRPRLTSPRPPALDVTMLSLRW